MATTSKFEVNLIDGEDSSKTLSVVVEAPGNGLLLLRPEGMGDLISHGGGDHPIALELYEGKVRLLVWADINKEDPTHTIDLSGALESSRQTDSHILWFDPDED